MEPTNETIEKLIAPSLHHAQVELVGLSWKPGQSSGLLRVTIDKPSGVTLDDCERVSLAISAVLDAYDPIAMRYRLEVSSPGAERPLTSPEHWVASLGRRVNVRYSSGDAEAVVEGKLLAAGDELVEVEIKQGRKLVPLQIAVADIIAARIALAI